MSVARLVLRCEAGAFLVDDSFQYRTLLAIYARSGGPSYFLVAPFSGRFACVSRQITLGLSV